MIIKGINQTRILFFFFFSFFLCSNLNAQEESFKDFKKSGVEKAKKTSIKKPNILTDTSKKFSGDLFADLDEQNKNDAKNKTDIVTAIFKTTRLINGHSIENVGKGVLDVRINHRFSKITDGAYGLWGMDAALMRMGVDYGISDRLMVGIGRSELQKTFDGFIKYRILRQSTGKVNMPISLSYVGSMQWVTELSADPTNPRYYSDRFSFTHQIIIATKVNDYFSFQLVPTLTHYNNTLNIPGTNNDYYSIGIGARQRLSKRINLTYEYYARINGLTGYTNSLSIGVDIETGGHVFQFNFSNSQAVNERAFINETSDTWNDGGIHFGFNIARVFTLKKVKKIL